MAPTQGGVLASELRKREADLNKHSDERIKIVEKGGLKVKDILNVKNSVNKCSKQACPLCTDSTFVKVNPEKNQLPCNTTNIGYRWHCLNCQEKETVKVYEGESGRSARIRGQEHLKDLEKKRLKSVLYKHVMLWMSTKMKKSNLKCKSPKNSEMRYPDRLMRQFESSPGQTKSY